MQEKRLWVLGDQYTFLYVSPELSVIEIDSKEGHGPPPHIHPVETETFYVLSGLLEVVKGNDSFMASAGAFVHVPAGSLHTFRTLSSEGSRILVTLSPGGLAGLFREIGVESEAEAVDPQVLEASRRKLLLLAKRYNLYIQPPLGA